MPRRAAWKWCWRPEPLQTRDAGNPAVPGFFLPDHGKQSAALRDGASQWVVAMGRSLRCGLENRKGENFLQRERAIHEHSPHRPGRRRPDGPWHCTEHRPQGPCPDGAGTPRQPALGRTARLGRGDGGIGAGPGAPGAGAHPVRHRLAPGGGRAAGRAGGSGRTAARHGGDRLLHGPSRIHRNGGARGCRGGGGASWMRP